MFIRPAIRAYQLFVSPLLGCNCRFAPSCSHYAIEAVEKHGAFKGGLLALKRILRCNPWGGSGFDPVPLKNMRSGLSENVVSASPSGAAQAARLNGARSLRSPLIETGHCI